MCPFWKIKQIGLLLVNKSFFVKKKSETEKKYLTEIFAIFEKKF